jgi:hypothetical protein
MLLVQLLYSLRSLIGLFRQDHLVTLLETRLKTYAPEDLKILNVEPYPKDGGIFVEIEVSYGTDMEKLVEQLRANVHKQGGVPGWSGASRGSIWRVRGTPWKEVSSHQS